MKKYLKAIPVPSFDSSKFWEGCRNHVLIIQRCLDCGNYRFPPGIICRHCMSEMTKWEEITGEGSVYSFTVVFRPVNEAFSSDIPYVIALIELKEGFRMLSNLEGCNPDEIKIGMPVKVFFEDVSEEISLPKFRPA